MTDYTGKYSVLVHAYGVEVNRTTTTYEHITGATFGLPRADDIHSYWCSRYPTAKGLATLLSHDLEWPVIVGDEDTDGGGSIVVVPDGRPGLFWLVLPNSLYPRGPWHEWCVANGFPDHGERSYDNRLWGAFSALGDLTINLSQWTVSITNIGVDCNDDSLGIRGLSHLLVTPLQTLRCDAKYAKDPARYDDDGVLCTEEEKPEPKYYRVAVELLDKTKWVTRRGLLDAVTDSICVASGVTFTRDTTKHSDAIVALSRVLSGRVDACVAAFTLLAGLEGVRPPALRISQYVSDDAETWSLYDAKVIDPVDFTNDVLTGCSQRYDDPF